MLYRITDEIQTDRLFKNQNSYKFLSQAHSHILPHKIPVPGGVGEAYKFLPYVFDDYFTGFSRGIINT